MTASTNYVLGQLQRWTAPRLEELSDPALLERFVQGRDESAFAALVSRHGVMVLRSCRRILGDIHDAEDAFQATFLILARKAYTIRRPQELPGWLHGVARRVALKARSKAAARPSQTQLPDELPASCSDPLTQLTARELLMVLDEEVARLPPAQRSAVVLCCLEGQTREEAARQLGWTLGSLKGRLERGRQRLQDRLARRGIVLSAVLALVAVSRSESASALLLRGTATAALGGGIGSSAAALAHSVLKTMFLTKLAAGMTVMLIAALVSVTAVAVVYRGSAGEDPQDEPPVAAAPKEPIADKPQPRTDALGDPLPDGAIARLGTVRLRHGGLTTFAAFTSDSKRLVSRGDDGVRVWDAATGKQLRYFAPEPGKIWGATDLSSDGKMLAAALESREGHIDFWDISSGKKTASFGHGYYALVRLSPDGKRLAAYESADGPTRAVELWDAASKRKLRTWMPHGRQQVMSLAFSADSRKLLTTDGDGKVRLWDTETGQQLQEFSRPGWRWDFAYADAALSPDGKLLALREANEKVTAKAGRIEWKARISLYDATTGKQVRMLTCPSQEVYPGQAPTFNAVACTADGKKLVTGGPDRFLRVWDWATGDELQRWPLELGRPWSLTPSRDGKWLAAVMYQGRAIQILDMASGKPRQPPSGHLAQMGWSVLTPAGRTAVTNGADSKLLLWDVAARRVLRTLKGHEDGSLSAMQLAPDGRTLYTVGWDKTVRVWDLSNGEELRRVTLEREFFPSGFGALALSPDGRTLAVLSYNKTIRILDATSGRELRRFEGEEGIMESAFAADSYSLVVCSGDLKVRIWDTRNGRLLRDYALPQELRIGQPIRVGGGSRSSTDYRAAVSPNGRLLAVANGFVTLPNPKYFLVLKDLATGQEVHRLDNLPAQVFRFAFSPDGRVLAWSGRTDCSIHLVETASGGERCRLPGHAGSQVYHLAFSADGSRLISSGSNTTALVWDVRNPAEHGEASAPELQTLWSDLAGKDAARAYRAIRKLAASSSSAIPFLRKNLQPAPPVDQKLLTRLIADLDSNDFDARHKAAAELEMLGESAMPAFRKALDGKPSLEARRRLDDLLDKAQRLWWDVTGERLRSLRAIEVLDLAGTKEAGEVLKMLADGAAGSRLTEEAKTALQRLTVSLPKK
jgi:RNA polymerase sigma factor (sigma-70 family)